MGFDNRKRTLLSISFLSLMLLSSPLYIGYHFTNEKQTSADFTDSEFVPRFASHHLLSDSTPQWIHDTETLTAIRPVAVSADGSTIVESSDDTVFLLDVQTEEVIWKYNTSSIIFDVALSDNGTRIAVGTYDNRTMLFNRESNQSLWTASGSHWTMAVAVSGDGSTITSGAWNGQVYVFDEESNVPISDYNTGARVIDVSCSYNGSIIAAGGENESLYVFDRGVSTPKWSYDAGDIVHSVSISGNGSIVATATFTGVFVFNSDSNNTLWGYDENSFQTIDVSSDGTTVAAGRYLENDDNLFVWDIGSNETLWTFNNTNQIRDVAVTADGKFIAAGGYDNKTYLFSRNNNDTLISYLADSYVLSVSLDSNGTTLISSSFEGKTYCWKITGPIISTIESPNEYENANTQLDFRVNVTRGTFALESCTLYYRNNSGTWMSASLQNQSASTESLVSFTGSVESLSEGLVEFYVEIIDIASYVASSQLDSFTVDGSPPQIDAVILPSGIPSSSDSVEISVQVNDTLSGIESGMLHYSNDSGTNWHELNPISTSNNEYVFVIPRMSNGTSVQFYLVFSDNVGNTIIDSNDGRYYEYHVQDESTSPPPDTLLDPMIAIGIIAAGLVILSLVLIYNFKFRRARVVASSSADESIVSTSVDEEIPPSEELEVKSDE